MSTSQLTKRCSTCQELLSVAEFSKNRTRKDGLQLMCKSCHKRYDRSAARKNYYKQYNLSVAGKATRKKYDSSELGRVAKRCNSEKYRKRHPNQMKARSVIGNLCAAGKLPYAKTLKCTHCGAQAKEYHHYLSYAEEHQLDVIPLCKYCHDVIRS